MFKPSLQGFEAGAVCRSPAQLLTRDLCRRSGPQDLAPPSLEAGLALLSLGSSWTRNFHK